MANVTAHKTELVLRATSRKLPNFDRYNVKVDMLDVGNPFTFSLWYSKISDSSWRLLMNEVKLGGDIVFSIDDAPQLAGRIETMSVVTSRARGCCLVISGRDLAGPAISWDANPKTVLRGRQLSDAIEALFEPLGITVVTGSGADAEREIRQRRRAGARGGTSNWSRRRNQVDMSRPRPGEKVMEVCLTIVRSLGYMAWVAPTSDGSVALVIDKPNYDASPDFEFKREIKNGVVTVDSDILDSDYHAQIRTIPTEVTAYGRAKRGNVLPTRHRTALNNFLNQTNAQAAIAMDEGDTRPPPTPAVRMPFTNNELAKYPFVQYPMPKQPLHLNSQRARNPRHGKQEARRAIAHAMKDFRAFDITVRGHGRIVDGEKRLFSINTMSHVRDDLINVDEDMLITGVEFMGSRSTGQETKITLGTKNAITLEPEAQ